MSARSVSWDSQHKHSNSSKNQDLLLFCRAPQGTISDDSDTLLLVYSVCMHGAVGNDKSWYLGVKEEENRKMTDQSKCFCLLDYKKEQEKKKKSSRSLAATFINSDWLNVHHTVKQFAQRISTRLYRLSYICSLAKSHSPCLQQSKLVIKLTDTGRFPLQRRKTSIWSQQVTQRLEWKNLSLPSCWGRARSAVRGISYYLSKILSGKIKQLVIQWTMKPFYP